MPDLTAAAAAGASRDYTVEDVRAGLKKLVKLDEAAVGDILARHGAKNVSQLLPEHYPSVMLMIDQAMA